jgi:acetyl esterase/lipase
MTFSTFFTRALMGSGDRRRDRGLSAPLDVIRYDNISYGPYGTENLLDIYAPKEAGEALPLLLSVHGGGYVYGNKEVYQYYCMSLAERGFVVANMNYRLAPRHVYPAPLEDMSAALRFLTTHAARYKGDRSHIFIVGDSVGAQIASQYALLLTNPEYAALFPFRVTDISIQAIGLNCGIYDLTKPHHIMKGVCKSYLGPGLERFGRQLHTLDYVSAAFPPAFISTSCHDFLRDNARPFGELLTKAGVKNEVHLYGSEDDTKTGHVFHLDIRNDEGKRCNDEECAFFKSCLKHDDMLV